MIRVLSQSMRNSMIIRGRKYGVGLISDLRIPVRFMSLTIVMLVCGLLQGCIAAVGTGVVAAGATAYDRRTTGTLIDDEIIEFKDLADTSGFDDDIGICGACHGVGSGHPDHS